MSQVNGRAVNQESDVQEQLTDLVGVLMRHPGVVAATLLITMVLGLLYFLKAPRTYESTSDILIVTKHFSGFNTEGDSEQAAYDKTIETHALMVASPLIVGRAVKDHELLSLETLSEEDDPVKAIIDELTVDIKQENTTVISLSYRSGNEYDCQKVVQALNDTYSAFLGESNQKVGREMYDLIAKANEELSAQLLTIDEDYQTFRKTAPPMYWQEGQGVNVHHERQARIEAARQEFMVEQTVLRAKLAALSKVITAGSVSRDAIRYEALSQLNLDEDYSRWRKFEMEEKEQFAEREAVREYASLLVGEYVRLYVEQSSLLDEYGEGHPKLNSVVKRRSQVKKMLNGMLENQMAINSVILNDQEQSQEEDDYVEIYIQSLTDRLQILDSQIAQLDRDFNMEQNKASMMQEFLLEDETFRSNKERTEHLHKEVVARLKEIDLVRDYGGDTMTVTAPPLVGEKVSPRLLVVLAGSLILGTLLGACVAWGIDASERTFRSTKEIRQSLGVPVVGAIPPMEKSELVVSREYPSFAGSLATVHRESSAVAEAFRGVRTNLYFSTSTLNQKVIQITSPLPGDGKSTVTANLAVSIAKSGKRVLVIDADFRRPTMDKLLGLQSEPEFGLAAAISGAATPQQAAQKTQIENLYFLPVLERPRQPSELLSTPEFAALIEQYREQFDFILIDTPPILAVSDPSIIAARADGILLTMRIRKGVQVTAARSMEVLNSLEANVIGVVANGWETSTEYGYGYGYGYGSYQPTNGKAATNGNGKGRIPLRKPLVSSRS